METAIAVGDGKLTNEELGALTRRFMEVIRRIKEGTVEKADVLVAFQMVAEGRTKQMVEPCKRQHRMDCKQFFMLAPSERRKSRAPLRMRPQKWIDRLYWKYRMFFDGKKVYGGTSLMPEDVIALMWEAENIPAFNINNGWTPIQSILYDFNAGEHDRGIVSATLQWLGTNTGREFLRRMVATANLDV